jgi:hypothetical protein
LRRERVEKKLEYIRSQLHKVEHEHEQALIAVNTFQAIPQRNIFIDAPPEIIVQIITIMNHFRDIVSLLDAVPRVKKIFVEHNLCEKFFRDEYPHVQGISDQYGFMSSRLKRHDPFRFEMPAGKYLIGELETLLAKDIFEELWIKKGWNVLSFNGLFSVDYNNKIGHIYAFHSQHKLVYIDGIYQYDMSSFGCVPISLVTTNTPTNAKMIESNTTFKWCHRSIYKRYLEVSWKNMDEEMTSLKIY